VPPFDLFLFRIFLLLIFLLPLSLSLFLIVRPLHLPRPEYFRVSYQPTNHLDLAAIRWLSDLLNEKKKMTLLTVTHDRAFLEEVCNSILELDRGQFYTYDGSYSNYLQGKEERLANEDLAIRVAKGKYKSECEFDDVVFLHIIG